MSIPVLEIVPFGGWNHCIRLTNGIIDVLVTTEVGPRVIWLGFRDAPNLLFSAAADLGQTGGDEWRIYGGHRFWVAPEDPVLTYCPDNEVVDWEYDDAALLLTQRPDGLTGWQKRLTLEMDPTHAQIRVTHELTNVGEQSLVGAPWALTAYSAGGLAVVPHELRQPHPEALLPARPVVLWPYTNMADPRWTWGRRAIGLRQYGGSQTPQKVGARNSTGWVAHWLGDTVMVKTTDVERQCAYPDMGCTTELFANEEMLEVETLGPLTRVEPGKSVRHVECWSLIHMQSVPSDLGWKEQVDVLSELPGAPLSLKD